MKLLGDYPVTGMSLSNPAVASPDPDYRLCQGKEVTIPQPIHQHLSLHYLLK
jgi:hypothetical protein